MEKFDFKAKNTTSYRLEYWKAHSILSESREVEMKALFPFNLFNVNTLWRFV